MKLRAILFSKNNRIQKLTTVLTESGIRLVSTTDIDELIALLKQKMSDLILVDSLSEQTEEVCHHIRNFETIPLVLIVNKKETDWQQIRAISADYLLPENARNGELKARIGVIERHFLPDRRECQTSAVGAQKISKHLH